MQFYLYGNTKGENSPISTRERLSLSESSRIASPKLYACFRKNKIIFIFLYILTYRFYTRIAWVGALYVLKQGLMKEP